MKSLNAWVCSIGWLTGMGLACGAWCAAAPAQDANATSGAQAQDPSQVVRSVAQSFLEDLDAHRQAYAKNPSLLRQAVDRDVLPYFDVRYAAQLVLARYWRTATPQQRTDFINAFENSMFSNYGNALLGFQSNRLQVLPTRAAPGAKDVIVRTVIRRDDGSTVSVNFVLHQTPEGWKAWDLIVEGISYVKSFRDDFGSEIEQQGLDAVIRRLQNGEQPAAIQNAGAKSS
jgi:phospholipid transport system substrate-binding protein